VKLAFAAAVLLLGGSTVTVRAVRPGRRANGRHARGGAAL